MKKNISLLLLIAILLLSFASCSFDFNGKDTSNGNNQNGQADGDDDGQDDENDNPPTPPIEKKDPIESFSPILQTVLKSEYYNEIIRQAKIDIQFKDYSHETSNRYQAIPYGFLEDEGYDIEAIKNDEIKCESDVFVLDGDLYIACRVENKASTTYYTHYVIKYKLNEQELSDLNLTHFEISDGSNISRTVSFQAPLFIQELSLVKNAKKLSEMYMAKHSEEKEEEHLATKIRNNKHVDMSDFGNSINATFLDYWNETGKQNTYKFLFFNQAHKATAVIQTKYVATISVTHYGNPFTNINSIDVYTSEYAPFDLFEQYYNEVANSKRKATFYNSYDSNFVDMLSPDYDQFYGLEK